jgi:thiamine biosynthesis lipoprotein
MGTVVNIQVVRTADQALDRLAPDAIERAMNWFRTVESSCNRFDPSSEVRQLSRQIGVAVPVSAILFEAVQFALAVAEESDGAFDPTVGVAMEEHGFDREYQSGASTASGVRERGTVKYRDVGLDVDARTITLQKPLLLDLSAVAKGLAIDLAARELASYGHFAVDAGGDLYAAGLNPHARPWSVGIRHPRETDQCIEIVQLSNAAMCTSGDYERRRPADDGGHHILDARTRESPAAVASATVIARSAMVADALATAAFVLGPADGVQLLERSGVMGVMFTPGLERFSTTGMAGAAIFPNA